MKALKEGLQVKMIAFEQRNNISITLDLCSDGSGLIKEFWNEEVLFRFDTPEDLEVKLKITQYQLDENGYCISPVQELGVGEEKLSTKEILDKHKTPLMELYNIITKSQFPKMDNSHQLDVRKAKRLVHQAHTFQKETLKSFANYLFKECHATDEIDKCIESFWLSDYNPNK